VDFIGGSDAKYVHYFFVTFFFFAEVAFAFGFAFGFTDGAGGTAFARAAMQSINPVPAQVGPRPMSVH